MKETSKCKECEKREREDLIDEIKEVQEDLKKAVADVKRLFFIK